MKQEEKVQRQFNQQAEQFSAWEVTSNEVNLQQFSRFCKFQATDTVLDVACGTGNMVAYCAPGVTSVDGVDIAERMVALARAEAARRQVTNVNFSVGHVENLPYENGGHSVVISRAAFHHFANPQRVIDEMLRCCCSGGRLFIQDIVTYGDPDLDAYLEKLETAIDSSHCKTIAKEEFTALFTQAELAGIEGVEFRIRLDLLNYVGHAVQSEASHKEVDHLINHGLQNPKLSHVFEWHNARLFLFRNVLFLGGRKETASLTMKEARQPRIVRLDLSKTS